MAISRRPAEYFTHTTQSWIPESYPPEGWVEHDAADERAARDGYDADQQMTREPRDGRSMNWRAAGVQFYPGGSYEALREASHRGRGPLSYRRSDERLHEIICEMLTDDPFVDASEITVEVRDCDVTLRGTVSARQQKYAAEDLVAGVTGVDEVHNQLSVDDLAIDERMSGL